MAMPSGFRHIRHITPRNILAYDGPYSKMICVMNSNVWSDAQSLL